MRKNKKKRKISTFLLKNKIATKLRNMLIKDVLIDSRRWVEYVGFLSCACKVPRGYSRFPLQPALGRRLRHRKTKLNIYHHMLKSSTQLQNRSFHVVERTRTSSKCQNMKNARAKRAKILFFIVKYANLWGFCCRHRRGCISSLLGVDATSYPL